MILLMTDRIYAWRPPTIYIEEWMKTVPGLDRKRLADRMGVSPGTVTKKLQDPAKIDGEWLARFAQALGLSDPTELYRNPEAPTPADLLRGLSEDEKREIITFADYVRNRRAS